MGGIDIILASLLGYAAFKGFKNGLFAELASLFSLFLGIFIALKFSFYAKEVLEKAVKWNPVFIQISAFVVTFVLVLVAIHFLVKSFRYIRKIYNHCIYIILIYCYRESQLFCLIFN